MAPPDPGLAGPELERVDAVLVVSFGGPEGPDDVLPFLENVTRGRGVPADRLREVAENYERVGGVSPLNGWCRRFVAELEAELAVTGPRVPVYWGNRNWHPYLADTVDRMAADGVGRALAFVTSAYSSYSGCRQYLEDLDAARAHVGPSAPIIGKLRQFYDHPGFVEPFVDETRSALAALPTEHRGDAALVFTAHSLPVAQAHRCDYEDQLRETARLIADRVGPPDRAWDLVWQSRSGPPQVPWLAPDVVDHLGALAAGGAGAATIVPIGFVADHLEVIHDLDVIARAAADELGLHLSRARTPGTDPRFVAMAAELVRERAAGAPRRSLGRLGLRPDTCPPGCCPPGRRPGH